MESNKTLAAALAEEIERFGLHDTPTNVHGLCAYADDELPAGIIRFDGDGVTTYVHAATSLVALRAVVAPSADFEAAQAEFYEAICEADYRTDEDDA